VDITDVAIASTIGTAFSTVSTFTEQLDAGATRIFFPTQQVGMIKVRFRQRYWRQKEGYKVFRYGLEELSLQLVDWDKSYDGAAAITANHTFGYYIDAPAGYKFTLVKDLFSTPDFELETAGSRHIHFKIAADVEGSTVFWDSDLNDPPRTTPVTITGDRTRLFVLTTMNFVSTSGGASSPFPVGTTPYLNRYAMAYTVEAL